MFLLHANKFPKKKYLDTEPHKNQIWMGTYVLALKSIWGSIWCLDLKDDCSGCGLAIQ